MSFSFDLISDLHVETWNNFDWTDKPTSTFCVVAGDVAVDRKLLLQTLSHLSKCYQGIFYIDGNDEHRQYLNNIGESYKDLISQIKKIENIVYMQDNAVVINGVALIATNGWWTYDFDPTLNLNQTLQWYQDHMKVDSTVTTTVTGIAHHDALYLKKSIKKLQTHQEVKSIAVITHTVPAPWIIAHDPDLINTSRFNCMGNSLLQSVLTEDSERKIKTWCFGHYHRPVDRDLNGIRYVNNCRGRGDTQWRQSVYQPKRITVEI
jgi:predicted phosphodiesterase